MRLYHTTNRDNCATIAAHGFKNSRAGTSGGGGVYLSPEVAVRWKGDTVGTYDPEDADLLPPDLVVFAFDIPDDIAATFACGGVCYLSPEDPEYDAEIDTPDPLMPDGMPPDEWVVPFEIVNRYFTKLFHWHGERPLTDAEIELMLSRRTG